MAPWAVIKPELFFRWAPPSWIAGAVGNLVLAVLLAVLASEQLEGFDSRRPALRRGVATLAWTTGWLLLSGAVIGYVARANGPAKAYSAGVAGNCLSPLFILLTLLLPLFGVLFVTGSGDCRLRNADCGMSGPSGSPNRNRHSAIRNRLRWYGFSDALPGGEDLVLVWAAIPFAIVAAGAAGAHLPWTAVLGEVMAPSAVVTAGVAMTVLGLGSLGRTLVGKRLHQHVLVYGALVLLTLAPYSLLVDADAHLPQPPPGAWLRWQFAYLLPTRSIGRLMEFGSGFPPLALDRFVPMWLVTGLLYAVIGLVTRACAAILGRRRG
jgi:hypothetical protein